MYTYKPRRLGFKISWIFIAVPYVILLPSDLYYKIYWMCVTCETPNDKMMENIFTLPAV